MIIINRGNITTLNNDSNCENQSINLHAHEQELQSIDSFTSNNRQQSLFADSLSPVYYPASPPEICTQKAPIISSPILPSQPHNSPESPHSPSQITFDLSKHRPAALIARTAFHNYKTNLKKKRMTCNELAKRELSLNGNGPAYVIHAVSQVEGHKDDDNVRFYLIKWYGWGKEYNSWVRESDCMCPIKILQYKRRYNRAHLDEL